jgi:heptose I phosphotransferase
MNKAHLYFTEIGRKYFSGMSFDQLMSIQGKAFRDVKGRKTIQIEIASNSFFIKQHYGVGWSEIFKNLLSFKLPIIGAKTEKKAIQALDEIGIATTPLVAFGERGLNPAIKQSFLITRDLGNIISLEDFCRDWKDQPPSPNSKRQIIAAVANLTKKMHEAGLIHRDFYLCHLCLDVDLWEKGEVKLYLIDLHRMVMNQSFGGRWAMKDIAALFFSAMDLGLNSDDLDLFKQYYCHRLPDKFWARVKKRANKLHSKFHSHKFQQRLKTEKASLKSF